YTLALHDALPISGATFSARSLLAVLTIRQQATPRFRSLKPYHLPGPDRASLGGLPAGEAACLAWTNPGLKRTLSFKGWGFRGLRLRLGPCRPHPLSYMRLTVAISRAFDRLGVWIGAPSGPSQPAAKRRE